MVNEAMLGLPGGGEWLILLLLVVLLFGAKKIPELARGLGEGIRNFKAGVRGDDDADEAESKNGGRITKGSDQS